MSRDKLILELQKLFTEVRTYNENSYLASCLFAENCPQSCEFQGQKHEHIFAPKYIDIQREWDVCQGGLRDED